MGSTKYKHQPVDRIGQEYQGKLLNPILTAMDRELLRLQEFADAVSSGDFAPDDAAYVTLASSSALSSERVLTVSGAGISLTDAGANSTVTIELDDDLDAIAALVGTSGLLAKTAANTWALRTLQDPAAGLVITNPAGVAGDPTFDLANDLAALEGLGSTGFATRTTTDTWAQRTLAAPAAGITISNPAGVAGNPTFALADDLAGLEGLATTGLAQRTGTSTWTTVTDSSTVGQVLRVDGAASYSWGALNLSDTDAITGDLPFSNLTQGSAVSVLGVAGASPADHASIVAGSDDLVLRRSGSSIGFGAINLAASAATTGDLPFSRLAQITGCAVLGVATTGSLDDVAAITCGTDHQTLRRSGSSLAFGALNLAQSAAVTGTLDETNGGTGNATWAQGDLIYGSASNTLTALAKNASATRYLSNTGTSNNPAWAQVDLTNGVTGELPAANIGDHDHSSSSQGGAVIGSAASPTEIHAGNLSIHQTAGIFALFDVSGLTALSIYSLPDGGGPVMVAPGTASPGDLFIWNATDNGLTGIPIGASGTILTSTGSVPQWSTNAAVVDVARTWATLQKFPDNLFNVVGSGDATKILRLEVDGITTATTRTWTVPDFDSTFVGTTGDQTITGIKTFAEPSGSGTVFSADPTLGEVYIQFVDETTGNASTVLLPAGGLSAVQSLTIPDASGVVVLTAGAQTIGQKEFSTSNVLISNNASSGVSFTDTTTSTKKLRMILASATGNNSFRLSTTSAREYEFTDSNGQVATSSNVLFIDDEIISMEDDLVTI